MKAASAQKLWEIVEPIVVSEGLELVELEFQREPRGWVLRLYIDGDDGVSLKDCTAISRQVGDVLDVRDPIDHPYHLEVSSPGVNRPIRKPEDFERFAGQQVRIKLSEPMEGRRTFTGVLLGHDEGEVRVHCDGKAFDFPLIAVAKARLIPS
jgi:ribosome maturation factor RimP